MTDHGTRYTDRPDGPYSRLHDPHEGSIVIDGVPVRDIPLHAPGREIGFVPQESLLFSDTIAANLGYESLERDSVEWSARTALLRRPQLVESSDAGDEPSPPLHASIDV